MYWLDTLLLALLALGGTLGFFSGFLCQIARILTISFAIFATVAFNGPASRFFQEQMLRDADPRIAQAVAYGAVFLAVYLVLHFASRILYLGLRTTDLEVVDRLLGGLLGAAKMGLVLGGCCLVASNYPHPLTHEWLSKSRLAPTFADGMDQVLVIIPPEYKDNLRTSMVNLRDLLSRPTPEPQVEDQALAAHNPPIDARP